jgi:hypothetical protein
MSKNEKSREILSVETIMKSANYETIYTELGVDVRAIKGSEMSCICPFHNDTKPSMNINTETGLWNCLVGCGGGNVLTFIGRKYEVSMKDAGSILKAIVYPINESIQQLSYTLRQNKSAMTFLTEKRGLSVEVIDKYKLGYNGDRITIPAYLGDRLVNIKYYKSGAQLKFYSHFEDLQDNKKITYGDARLYPFEQIHNSTIYLFEGEMDALLAISLGLPAITNSNGAGTWMPEWTHYLRGKVVNICYDNDKPGQDGAAKVACALVGIAKEVKVINLFANIPEAGKGDDFTDFIVKHKHTLAEFLDMVSKAPLASGTLNNELTFNDNAATAQEPSVTPLSGAPVCPDKQHNSKPIETSLRESSKPEYVGKRLSMPIMISGKDLTPFIVPRKFTAKCNKINKSDKDLKGRCYACSLAGTLSEQTYLLDEKQPMLLKLIRSNDLQNKGYLRQHVGIPESCHWWELNIVENQNVEEIRAIPDLDLDRFSEEKDIEYTARILYSLSPKGDRMRTNASYNIEGVATPSPTNQYATVMFSNFENKLDDIKHFEMTPDIKKKLEIFHADKQTLESLTDRMAEIYKDFEHNVTRIYSVDNIVQVLDWTMFSVLDFKFLNDYVGRGYVEALVVGDTATGKSKSVEKLWRHYRGGEYIVGKNLTFAGLIGGISQIQGRHYLQWGKWALNDGRALIIDEFGGISEEIISQLTAIRSSGVVELVKIVTERTNGRVRMLGLANPRSGDFVTNYNYGVQILRHLIGKAEDIRRFDVCVIAGKDEYKITDFEIYEKTKQEVPHKYTSELNNLLLRWVWSRTRDQIHFTSGATRVVLEVASALSAKYSANIPLVEPAEQRIKVARLAVATAARVFSTKTGDDVLVEEKHVRYVEKRLTEIYDSPSMAYDLFSKNQANKNTIGDEDLAELIKEFKHGFTDRWQDIRDVLLDENKYFKRQDLTDILTETQVRDFLRWARQNKLMRATTGGYQKTPIFMRLLRDGKVLDTDAPGHKRTRVNEKELF